MHKSVFDVDYEITPDDRIIAMGYDEALTALEFAYLEIIGSDDYPHDMKVACGQITEIREELDV